MKTINQTFSIFVGLLLLGALAYGGIAAIEYVSSLFMSLDPQLARAATIILLVVLITGWTFSRSVRKAAGQKVRQQLISEIATTYQYFTEYWIRAINLKYLSNNAPETQHDLDRLMALYGSAEAINAHLALRTMFLKKDMQPAEMRTQFGKALLAIRKDLGADSQGLSAKDLAQLLLPEPNPNVESAELPQSKTESEPASGA
jgi:hypothetical protein